MNLAGLSAGTAPTRVRTAVPGELSGYTFACVEMTVRVTGTGQWPLNPESLGVLVDDAGHGWNPALFAQPPGVALFDAFRPEPGDPQTASVCYELPPGTVPVALMISPYPGLIHPWRL